MEEKGGVLDISLENVISDDDTLTKNQGMGQTLM